jgi:hypothetical protein
MLHALLRGDDLTSTIHMNILTRDMVAKLPNGSWGTPLWATERIDPQSENAAQMAMSFIGGLVTLSRAIRLEPGRNVMTLANGIRYPKLPDARNVSGTVIFRTRNGQQEPGYVAVDLSRHPWRELSSILALMTPQDVASGPLALEHLHYIKTGSVDLWTGGLAADKGKVLDIAEWVFQIPVAAFQERSLRLYANGVSMAERGGLSLRSATYDYASELKKENTYLHNARSVFWSILDAQHTVLLEAAGKLSNLNTTWYPLVRNAMLDAYKRTCPHKTSRQTQAYALGFKKLYLKKFKEGNDANY